MNPALTKTMRHIDSFIERICTFFYNLCGIGIFFMMAITCIDVGMRFFAQSPLGGSIELTELTMFLILFFGLGKIQLSESHIAVDLLTDKLSPRAGERVFMFVSLLTALLAVLMSRYLFLSFLDKMQSGEYTPALFLKLSVFIVFGLAGALVFTLAALRNIVTHIGKMKSLGISMFPSFLAAVLVTVFLIVRLMFRLLRRHKLETKRLEHTLKHQSSELERLKTEKDLDEASRKSLEASLRQQISSNRALMGYYNLNNDAMRRLIKIFNIYKGDPKYFLTKAVGIAENLIVQTGGSDNVFALIDTAYPGFLDKLFVEFPDLKDEEKYLIALTCIGYPNGTVSYLLNISETNLSTKRTRLAQKMSLGKSLVKYLNERLASYRTESGSVS